MVFVGAIICRGAACKRTFCEVSTLPVSWSEFEAQVSLKFVVAKISCG